MLRPSLRRLVRSMLLLCVLLVVPATALWIWSGSEGSLAATLRWVAYITPLTTQQVTGSLRGGGHAAQLIWNTPSLRVQAQDAELRWQPGALLERQVHITRLTARSVVINDHSSSSHSAPPTALALPVTVQLDDGGIGTVQWVGTGPQTVTLQHIRWDYSFDGQQHRLHVKTAHDENGSYQLQARLAAHAPLQLDARLSATLTPEVPGTHAPLPLHVEAALRGPLQTLQLQADIHPQPDSATDTSPKGTLTARVRPWATQPLAEARVQLQHFNLASLWKAAPATSLSGLAQIQPQTEPAGVSRWLIHTDLHNDAAGPWDRGRLPVQALQARILWRPGHATVQTLEAHLAGGVLQADGDWSAASNTAPATHWQLQTRVQGLDPAQLHTQLAALPLDGKASASGTGDTMSFTATLQARPAKPAPVGSVASTAPPIRLQGATVRGQFTPGLFTLEQFKLATNDAQASGNARLRLHGKGVAGGQAHISAQAPGMSATLQGDLYDDTGAGSAQWQMGDAAQALAWLARVPGIAPLLPPGFAASGQAQWKGRWTGGWRTPQFSSTLTASGLTLSSQGLPSTQIGHAAITLDGTPEQAQLTAQARASQGARQIGITLAATGGRDTPHRPSSGGGWHTEITQLRASLHDPALSPGWWQMALQNTVAFAWSSPAAATWRLGQGRLALTAPAPEAQAMFAWNAIASTQGRLTSSGQLTGMPLQWLECIGGPALQSEGLTGDVILGGSWQLALTDHLQLKAELARTGGDLVLRTANEDVGGSTQITAGLREARATLTSDGHALALQLRWDSARAGQASADLHSELAVSTDAAGHPHWSWPQDAPLQGSLQLHLPKIAAWSALAPPGWRLGGSLSVQASVSGTRLAPQLSGSAGADDLALRSIVDGIEFGQGRLRARFADTRLIIDEFVLHGASSQGGELQAHGEAGWTPAGMGAHLQATLHQLRVSIRSDRDITVSGGLLATLHDHLLKIGGALQADHARVELPDAARPTLSDDVVAPGGPPAADQISKTSAAKEASANPPLEVQVDLGVDLGQDFRVHGVGADTLLTGKLRLSSQGPMTQMPQLTGLVETRSGRFQAYGQKLDIIRGHVRFTGAIDNPTLDIIALRPNFSSDQKVGVQVSGSALLPRISLYSEPALPDNQALAWLLLGHAAPANGAESAMLQSAALALLGGRNGRSLASHFGLDELSVARDDSGSTTNTSITLGKRLSERLYAAYEHSLAGTGSTLLIFYELSHRWSLRAQAGENAALDLIWRLSFD